MIKIRQLAVAAAVSALCATAFAAEEKIVIASLGDVSGKVLINKGQGFVSAKPGMEVSRGDRVIALDNASAKVVFNEGCVTDLKENNLLDAKGCSAKPVNPRAGNIKLAAAIGATAVDAAGGAGAGASAGAGAGAGAAGGAAAGAGGAAAAGGLGGMVASLGTVGTLGVVGGGVLAAGAVYHQATKDKTPVSGQ